MASLHREPARRGASREPGRQVGHGLPERGAVEAAGGHGLVADLPRARRQRLRAVHQHVRLDALLRRLDLRFQLLL